MVKIDQLRKMKLPELIKMRDDISIIIGEKQTVAKDDFKKEMEEKARAQGFDLGELFGFRSKRGPKKGGTAKVKYRDPKNPESTWSGRGRPAKWLADYMAKGKKKEDFLA
jgi:DNA-binding protein H-NS